MHSFRCPKCGNSVEFQDKRIICQSCGHHGEIDDFGIIRLTSKDFYYREMPRKDLQYILMGKNKSEILRRFDEISLKKNYQYASYIKSYALDAKRAAGVFLLDLNEQSMVLDFGSGWGNITHVLATICKQVISLDLTYESLLFSCKISNANNIQYIHGGDGRYLPFDDDSFDAVILNGVLEWIPEGSYLAENPRSIQQHFLNEVHRILRIGGQVYVGIENRYGMLYFLGVKEDHTGLRFGALLPRKLSNIYSRLVRKRPYRTYTYSYNGYRHLLGESGFETIIYHPWPNYRRFTKIYTPETVNTFHQFVLSKNRSLKGQVASAAINVLTLFSVFHWFTPAFVIIGTKGHATNKVSSLLTRIVERRRNGADEIRSITISSTQTILVRTSIYFYKIPLTKESRQRINQAIKAQNVLQSQFPSLAQYAVVDTKFYQIGSLIYSKEPLCDPVELDELQIEDLFRLYFKAVDQYAQKLGLDLCGRLSRVIEFAKVSMKDELGVKNQVRKLSERTWPIAPTHGDFHRSNVIKLKDGRLALTDWDRFEVSGPYHIDAIHAFLRGLMHTSRITWPEAIETLKQEILQAPLKKKSIYGMDIDYDILTLYVLDKLEKDISSVPHYSYLGEPWRSQADFLLHHMFAKNPA